MLARHTGGLLDRAAALAAIRLWPAVIERACTCAGSTPQSRHYAAVAAPQLADPSLPVPRFIVAEARPRRAAVDVATALAEVKAFSRFIVAEARPRRAAVDFAIALAEVKAAAGAKFDETVEVALKLGTDPRRGDHAVRGAVMLPHGTGKTVRVAVFAQGEAAAAAREAGAEVVGADELIERIRVSGGSGLAFDKCVATPDMMPKLGKIARILGPRGLMPNPKMGTVTLNVASAVQTMKAGRVEFRADKGAVLHAPLGKASFEQDKLYANLGALVSAVLNARPKGLKGSGLSGYISKASLSSTMGRGVPVTLASITTAVQAYKKLRGT
ncbi:hypothetical protein WJX72_005189 [[Myrmecia] bisecta]|uniref:Ribosomal protein n=1 Tax=[Myrmecia] bisecta TaxID=41462 RepID=A0AAW1R7L0_9CHLO